MFLIGFLINYHYLLIITRTFYIIKYNTKNMRHLKQHILLQKPQIRST